MGLFSPLRAIFETKKYPHARTLRSSLKDKFFDTFHALIGQPIAINLLAQETGSKQLGYSPDTHRQRQYLASKYGHFGIFDYVTLFIPLVLSKLNNMIQLPLLHSVLDFALSILRFTFSAAVAIAVFIPIVLPITLIAKLCSRKEHGEVLKTQNNNKTDESFKQFLETNHLGLEDLTGTVVEINDESNNGGNYTLIFQALDWTNDPKNNLENEPSFSVVIPTKVLEETNTTEAKNLSRKVHSFFELNVGGIWSKIEKSEDNAMQQALSSI